MTCWFPSNFGFGGVPSTGWKCMEPQARVVCFVLFQGICFKLLLREKGKQSIRGARALFEQYRSRSSCLIHSFAFPMQAPQISNAFPFFASRGSKPYVGFGPLIDPRFSSGTPRRFFPIPIKNMFNGPIKHYTHILREARYLVVDTPGYDRRTPVLSSLSGLCTQGC